MKTLIKLPVLALAALPLLVGCAAANDPAEEPSSANDDALTLDFCKSATADKVTSVGSSTDFITAKSSGATYAADGCKFFLWDVTPTVDKNLSGYTALPTAMPTDSLSCWNLTVRERQYVKGATGFDVVYTKTSKGVWAGGVCSLKQSSVSGTSIPYVGKAGVTYRFGLSASVLETGPDVDPYTVYQPVMLNLYKEPS